MSLTRVKLICYDDVHERAVKMLNKTAINPCSFSVSLQDIGHSILEAYSRVLLNLAHNILTRIGEVLQVDFSSNVNSPAATVYSSPISSDETLVYRSDEQS